MKNADSIDAFIGSRVRIRRMTLGISQEQLGDALDLTFQQIQKYEKGQNRMAGRGAVVVSGFAQDGRELKVFIGVDMEGIAGVVTSSECSSSGPDYDYFRRIMTEETNAAIRAALDAGATEIVVRDGHGSGRNILPGLLHEKAKLVRGWSGGPCC